MLVNPQEKLLMKFKDTINQKYDDLLLDAISGTADEESSNIHGSGNFNYENKSRSSTMGSRKNHKESQNRFGKSLKKNSEDEKSRTNSFASKTSNFGKANSKLNGASSSKDIKIVILFTDPRFFLVKLKHIVKKCIVLNCHLNSEFSWRHLHKDILINFFEFPDKMSMI